MAFPDYEYINLERQNTQRLMKQDAESFLRQYTKGAIIDEAQLVPEVFSAIQVLVDENPSLRFVLSGGSDFLLNALLRCVFCKRLFINDLSNAAAKAVFMVIREKAPTFASSENNKNKAL